MTTDSRGEKSCAPLAPPVFCSSLSSLTPPLRGGASCPSVAGGQLPRDSSSCVRSVTPPPSARSSPSWGSPNAGGGRSSRAPSSGPGSGPRSPGPPSPEPAASRSPWQPPGPGRGWERGFPRRHPARPGGAASPGQMPRPEPRPAGGRRGRGRQRSGSEGQRPGWGVLAPADSPPQQGREAAPLRPPHPGSPRPARSSRPCLLLHGNRALHHPGGGGTCPPPRAPQPRSHGG